MSPFQSWSRRSTEQMAPYFDEWSEGKPMDATEKRSIQNAFRDHVSRRTPDGMVSPHFSLPHPNPLRNYNCQGWSVKRQNRIKWLMDRINVFFIKLPLQAHGPTFFLFGALSLFLLLETPALSAQVESFCSSGLCSSSSCLQLSQPMIIVPSWISKLLRL